MGHAPPQRVNALVRAVRFTPGVPYLATGSEPAQPRRAAALCPDFRACKRDYYNVTDARRWDGKDYLLLLAMRRRRRTQMPKKPSIALQRRRLVDPRRRLHRTRARRGSHR